MVLEKTLKSSLDSKEIKPVNPNGNQSSDYFREEGNDEKGHKEFLCC